MIVQADERVSDFVNTLGVTGKLEPVTPSTATSPTQPHPFENNQADHIDNDDDPGSTPGVLNVGSSVNYSIPTTQNKTYSYCTSVLNDRSLFTKTQLIERAAIVNSLIYVSLFYRFDHTNPSLLYLLQEWKNLRLQQLTLHPNWHDTLTEEVREALCPPTSVEALYKYIFQCADYDVTRENDNVLRPGLSHYDPSTMIGSYVYCRLQTLFRTPKYTIMVIELLTRLIRSTSTTPTNLSENYDPIMLRNSLHLVKLVLPQLYITPNASRTLQELMTVVQNFFLEPNPVGSLCQQVLTMCHKEQANRGILNRERFDLSVRYAKDSNGNVVEKRRKVHILFNGRSEYAHNLVDRFNINSGELNPDDVLNTKANLAINFFEQSNNKDIQAFAPVLEKDVCVAALCEKYRQIITSSPAELTEIHQELLRDPRNATQPKVVRKPSCAMPEVDFELIELPDEPDLSQARITRKVFPLSVIYDQLKILIEQARADYVPGPSDTIKLDVAIAGGSGTLQHFVHSVYVAHRENLLVPSQPDRPTVELQVYLIPLGQQNHLSNWLEKYDGWYSRHIHYPALSKINLVPQLKPTKRFIPIDPSMLQEEEEEEVTKGGRTKRNNTMTSQAGGSNSVNSGSGSREGSSGQGANNAEKSASHRKSVLIASPVKSVQKRRPVTGSQYKAPTKFLTPHRFMRTLLSDYAIDAQETLPVHIYNVQLLCNEVTSTPQGNNQASKIKGRRVVSFLSLCFCQRLDIGIYAEALQYQKDNKMEGLHLEDILQHKQFKYSGVQLNVSYVPMDPTGELNRSSEINEPTKTFQSISIRSTSRFGDKGSLVGPNQPWLEVFADENVAKQSNKKRVKLRECDMGTQYHVGSLTIESPSVAQFSVLMDGELYGPFHKVIINATDLSFPLKTFNKVEVY
ncbi:hypothetical protein AKO1_013663 [Acrasis kona]|uniref:Uncharacterized protein n=1 Tax=Acrasis kona TaxID=1008807 RepID=A0AAW2YWI1_9EUKA